MKRVFVFQDFKSQKFWSIEVVGTDVTVNYGKLGTDGQTQVKNYATTEEAESSQQTDCGKDQKRVCRNC